LLRANVPTQPNERTPSHLAAAIATDLETPQHVVHALALEKHGDTNIFTSGIIHALFIGLFDIISHSACLIFLSTVSVTISNTSQRFVKFPVKRMENGCHNPQHIASSTQISWFRPILQYLNPPLSIALKQCNIDYGYVNCRLRCAVGLSSSRLRNGWH